MTVILIASYLYLPNKILNSSKLQNYISSAMKDNFGLDLVIDSPKLKTKLKPEVDLDIKKLKLTKNSKELAILDDFSLSVDFSSIFDKNIKLKKLLAKKLVLKTDELLEALEIKNNQQTKTEFDYNIDLFDSDIRLNDFFVTYKQPNNTILSINANNIKLNCKKDFKELAFVLDGKISDKNSDFAKIYINSN